MSVSKRQGRPHLNSCRPLAGVALVLGALALGGCSSGSTAVVVVGKRSITSNTVNHWIEVVAVRDYELKPQHTPPNWVLPVPPHFEACVAHLKTAQVTPGVASVGKQKLVPRCAVQYAALREQALSFLITGESFIGEAEDRGLTMSAALAQKRMHKVIQTQYGGSRSAFNRDLALAHETVADQIFRAKIKLATEGIEHQIFTAPGLSAAQRQRVYVLFSQTFPRAWARRTSCQHGYVVPNCRQYHGTREPQIVL